MYKRAVGLALLALLASGLDGLAQKPKPARENAAPRSPRVVQTSLATVTESEPNDAYTEADAVVLGDVGSGVIDPAGDWDWWSISLTAGQVVEIDVDASAVGSDLDPLIELFAADGETSVAMNDDWDGLDSRIEYTVETTGTYYLVITDYSTYWGYGDYGGSTYTYTISFSELLPGPGDPATTLITGLDCIEGMTVGSDGTLYLSDPCDDEIYTVSTAGVATTFTTEIFAPGPLAFDAFGNLLAISYGDGNVYKISPDAEVDTFATELYPGWIATAPDGSIWINAGGGLNAPSEFRGPQPAIAVAGGLRHYDAMGTFVDSLVIAEGGPGPFTFGPDGDMYYVLEGRSIGAAAYKIDANVPEELTDSMMTLVDGTPQALFGVPCCTSGIAIDGDGNFYVANGMDGTVVQYGPTGTVLADPFARSPIEPYYLIFGRDADGTPNTTLYYADYEGEIFAPGMNVPVEGSEFIASLNPNGPDAPGFGNVVFDLLADDNIAAALMGDVDALTAGEMDFLDFMGNQNGGFDIGDLRAYLIYIGVLPQE